MTQVFRTIVLWILRVEASLVIRRFKPVIIGITGSVGKTSAKEAIAAVLGEHFRMRKSPKSYNSELGLPLTILGLESAWHSSLGWLKNIIYGALRVISRDEYPELLVLEMGVDRPGDFDKVLPWLKPNVGVVTMIGDMPVHVEFFDGPDAVAAEKSKLVEALPEEGVAIINADDPRVLAMQKQLKSKVITYGFSRKAEVRASGVRMSLKKGRPDGMTFKIDYQGKTVPIRVPGVVGEQSIYAFLAAAAVGLAQDLNLIEISEALLKYEHPPGRLRLLDGQKNSLILDDTYNSSPLAALAALEALSKMPAERRIAALGDMLELGKYTPEAHRMIGKRAAEVADVVIAVGVRAKFMDIGEAAEFHWFAKSTEAADFLGHFIREGDAILVKGSQGVRMEKIVKALLLHSEDSHHSLVRQEEYWQSLV
ncbi:MAG: UDP-N-acetylmuramoyl-tripeptide--D-alanyl-D-alanine ligase [Patescibacteria group bacterium]